MNVTLCSHFRNATPYIDRYFAQVRSLASALGKRGDELNLILCEGDSTDDTIKRMLDADMEDIEFRHYGIELFSCNHGGKDYGSIVHRERFANIAKVCNAIWQRLPADTDVVVWMESDLIWEPATVLALLDHLAHVPAVAPMVMLRREGYPPNFFYDSWAFRKDGRRFSPMPPYAMAESEDVVLGRDEVLASLIQVDSAGSCLVMRGDVARAVTWPSEDVIVGVCRQINEQGGSVWLAPNLQVTHL